MYFSQSFQARGFADLMATHPSIDERVENISGQKLQAQGELPKSAAARPAGSLLTTQVAVSSFGGEVRNAFVNMVGRTSPQHVEQAVRQLAAMPDSLRDLLGTPQGARSAILAYFLSSDAAVIAVQSDALIKAEDANLIAGLPALNRTLRELGPAARLTVLSLALPALRQMAQPQRDSFLAEVDQLVMADHEVTLGEFVFQAILGWQLAAKSSRAGRVQFRTLEPVKADARLLLATLANASGGDAKAQQFAFERGMARLQMSGETSAVQRLDSKAVSTALNRLRGLAPLQKHLLVQACVDTALADNQLLVAEVELLRAVGMAIDCPMPSTLESQKIL